MAKFPPHSTDPVSSLIQNVTGTQEGPKEARTGHFMPRRTQRLVYQMNG